MALLWLFDCWSVSCWPYLSIGPESSVSVQSVLWWAYLIAPCCFDFVFCCFNDQSENRSLNPHAVCKSVSDRRGCDLCLIGHDFSPPALLNTASRLHCASDGRGHFFQTRKTHTWGFLHDTVLKWCETAGWNNLNEGPKCQKRLQNHQAELSNCGDGQPSCAILRYNN